MFSLQNFFCFLCSASIFVFIHKLPPTLPTSYGTNFYKWVVHCYQSIIVVSVFVKKPEIFYACSLRQQSKLFQSWLGVQSVIINVPFFFESIRNTLILTWYLFDVICNCWWSPHMLLASGLFSRKFKKQVRSSQSVWVYICFPFSALSFPLLGSENSYI